MPSKKNQTTLQLRGLELHANLGWRKKERGKEQAILLDIDLYFPETPKACVTDDLQDTICYAQLIEKIRCQIEEKNFHLLEHLTYEVYQLIKLHTPAKTKISVRVTKYPQIKGLTGGACFCYEDKSSS